VQDQVSNQNIGSFANATLILPDINNLERDAIFSRFSVTITSTDLYSHVYKLILIYIVGKVRGGDWNKVRGHCSTLQVVHIARFNGIAVPKYSLNK